MAKNSPIRVLRESSFSGGTKLVLEECPFDGSHRAPDSAVFLRADGSIGFKCFHNSCAEYGWKDLRQHLEPGAYQPRVYTAQAAKAEPAPKERPADVFLRVRDVEALDRSKIVSIKTGFTEIDKKIIGFNKGEMSVWSGGNGSGKSTFLSQLALEVVQRGFTAAMFSGELTSNRMKNWLYLQAAGATHTRQASDGVSWYVDKVAARAIDEWLGDKLWLYNNRYGNKATSVLDDFERHIAEHRTDVIFVDNLMSLDLGGGADKLDGQTRIALRIQAAYEAKRDGRAGEVRRIKDKVLAMGFSGEMFDSAVKQCQSLNEPSETVQDPNKALDAKLYDGKDLLGAVSRGNVGDINAMVAEIKADSDAKDPMDSVRSSTVTKALREQYIGHVDKNEAAMALALKTLLTESDLGYTAEQVDDWVKDDRSDDMRAAVSAGKAGEANQSVAELQELGRKMDSICQSLTSTYKPLLLEKKKNGDVEGYRRLKQTLMALEVYDSKGKRYFTAERIEGWER